MATAKLFNDLYRIDCTASRTNAFMANDKFEIWHRRLGHICNKSLVDVKNANVGVQYGKIYEQPCVTCVKGKQTRNPSRVGGTRATGLLQLVHSDAMGPLPEKSFGGARFLVTFVDHFSRKVFVYSIKSKSDVFSEIF